MPSMPVVTIDPYLIALPKPCATAEVLDSYIDSLLSWSDTLRDGEIDVCISASCIAALHQDGLYPYDHELGALLKAYNIIHIDRQTISRLAQSVIERTPLLEDRLYVINMEHNRTKTVVQPPQYVERLPLNSQLAFVDTLVMMGIAQQNSSLLNNGSLIATTADDDVRGQDELNIIAEVIRLDVSTRGMYSDISFPVALNDSFSLCFGHEDVLVHIGCQKLWDNAKSEHAVMAAFSARTTELIRLGVAKSTEVAEITLGSKFLLSIHKWGFSARSDWALLLIDSCARVAIGKPKNNIIPFRVSSAPTAKQKKRSDGALAFRTHLTEHGAGFRLMFWKMSDGTVEFANVGDKDELVIES